MSLIDQAQRADNSPPFFHFSDNIDSRSHCVGIFQQEPSEVHPFWSILIDVQIAYSSREHMKIFLVSAIIEACFLVSLEPKCNVSN